MHEWFLKDDRAFSLLHQHLHEILVICFPKCLLSKAQKKIWGHRENLGESGLKVLRDLTLKSVNFNALATSDIKISLFFGEVDKPTKLVRSMK